MNEKNLKKLIKRYFRKREELEREFYMIRLFDKTGEIRGCIRHGKKGKSPANRKLGPFKAMFKRSCHA
jgi:hypothetical protein